MKSFTILSFVLATILGLLQFGWETDALASPIPPTNGYPYQQYSYQQPAMSQYYGPQYSVPQYSMPQYSNPKYVPQVQAPSYIAPRLPSEFEGLSDQSAIVGNENIDFTGFDILGDVELPLNILSLTDILG